MYIYKIEGKTSSPEVLISGKENLVEISGNSTLKDTNWFYSNLLKWVIAFNYREQQTEKINIRLERINDSSAKWLILILKKLSKLLPKQNFQINWYFQKPDDRVERIGRQVKNELGQNVNLLIA